MLYQYLRVIDSDNSVLIDLSIDNQDKSISIPFDLIVAEDYIYLGQQFPFNNFFMQTTVVNDIAANISLEYWDSVDWRAGLDVIDGTKTGSVSLAKSGVIQFSPSRNYRWTYVYDTSETSSTPTELRTLNIYNLYWLRMKYSDSLKATTSIKRIAYAFTTSQQISDLDTTINQYFNAFSVGKTNWDDEIITASMQVTQDLKRQGLIINPGQILRFDDVTEACNWKTLMHIYRNLGGDYATKYAIAEKNYQNAMDIKIFTFDRNANATVDLEEIDNLGFRMTRS